MRVSEAARGLERLLARRRAIDTELFTLDAAERWGACDTDAREEARAEGGRRISEKCAIDAELTARVARLRVDDPAALQEWASAHRALLERFLAQLTDAQRTERMVAEGERAAWEAVSRGEAAFVDQNTHYVRYDSALFAALFGDLSSDGEP